MKTRHEGNEGQIRKKTGENRQAGKDMGWKEEKRIG